MCAFLYYHTLDDIVHLTYFPVIKLSFSRTYYYIQSVYFFFRVDYYVGVQIFMQNIS